MIATIMTFISGQQSNCQFGKSTLRQKVWKFTLDNLTNGLSTGHPWCADIIKPDNITPISSASIICGNNTILSGILTQHSDIYSPHSPHCKHHETHFRECITITRVTKNNKIIYPAMTEVCLLQGFLSNKFVTGFPSPVPLSAPDRQSQAWKPRACHQCPN